MKSFNPGYLKNLSFHTSTTWHLNGCSEFRGMQEMWKKVRPEALKLLRESALIQSAESSNRIEGVEVAKDRLRPLVIGEVKPRDRSEEEIVGYRKALGNGRTSRLLLLLLLYQSNFEVGRFISLEKIVEETKEDYHQVLGASSENWHQGTHNLMPWWNYSLGVIKSAYKELQMKVSFTDEGDSKSSMIRQLVTSMDSSFSVAELLKLQPGIDRELVKKVLSDLKKNGEIYLIGRGRGARWKKR
ncbi:MAG: hypothetical protein KA715_04910 [Xanthomonadaceae bacterium]|nr:hypothetical protein [Xanthomonadaceae bacterium]